MPIYEYRCLGCGKKLDLLLKDAGEKGPCPTCGGELQRVYSTFAFLGRDHGSPFSDSALIRGVKEDDPKAWAEWGRRAAGGGPVTPEYTKFLKSLDEPVEPVE